MPFVREPLVVYLIVGPHREDIEAKRLPRHNRGGSVEEYAPLVLPVHHRRVPLAVEVLVEHLVGCIEREKVETIWAPRHASNSDTFHHRGPRLRFMRVTLHAGRDETPKTKRPEQTTARDEPDRGGGAGLWM